MNINDKERVNEIIYRTLLRAGFCSTADEIADKVTDVVVDNLRQNNLEDIYQEDIEDTLGHIFLKNLEKSLS